MSEPENKPKARRGGFQKGVSGNPGGRPKVREEFRSRARKVADEECLEAWAEEVRNRGPQWVKAAELLVAYAYGKPSSAPEDLDALRESGPKALAVLTREELLAVARGEKP